MEARPIAIVVDYSKPFLMSLSTLLNRMNLEVLPVSNAAEAIDVSRVTRPSLITMDMMMPDMDGLEALHAIRVDDRSTGHKGLQLSGQEQAVGGFKPWLY